VNESVFTFVGLWLIDRFGTRPHFLIVIRDSDYRYMRVRVRCVYTSMYCRIYEYPNACRGLSHRAFFDCAAWAFLHYIAAHAIGHRARDLGILFLRYFRTAIRAEGQTLGVSHIGSSRRRSLRSFPKIVVAFPPGYVFSFFAGMMVLQLIW